MKKRTRNILIGLGFVGLFFVGLFCYGAYTIYSFFAQFDREIPAELKDARVVKGDGVFTRTEIFRLNAAGLLKGIGDAAGIRDEKEREKVIQSHSAKRIYSFADIKIFGEEIIAAGQFGAYIFDLSGNLKRQILFEPAVEKIKVGPYESDTYQSSLDNLRIVHLENNKLGFLSFGFSQGARVFDENGNQIWSTGTETTDLSVLLKDEKGREADYENRTSVLEAAVGDLDNDGVSEYIVARKNDGIRAYDRNGKERWFQPADYPSSTLEVFDLDGDGKNELLELGENVRDGNGNVLSTMKVKVGNAFLTVKKNPQKSTIEFLDVSEGKLTCSDIEGKTIFEAVAPLSHIKTEEKKIEVPGHPEASYIDDSENVGYPRGVWISFQKDKPKYLAVVAAFIGIPRAHLYIYESGGNLVYHELLDQEADTIAVLPASNGNESLLVGGKDTIWKYSPN